MATQFSDTKGQVARTNSDEKLGGQDEHLENPTLAEKGVTGSGVFCSAEDNDRIRKKTDMHLLPVLMVIYFLQIADKTIIGLTAVYGLRRDANLVGNQYSTIGAMGYYAQLVAQPLAAVLLVKFRYSHFMASIVILWAGALLGMAGSENFQALAATRFLLGFFEAAAIPLFSVITISFYRRSEQPLRVAAWYGTNGLATIFCSPLCYGLARIRGSSLYTYQIIYLFFGLITVIVGVASYFLVSDSPSQAKFLSPEDRLKAVERLKANQQGITAAKFNWGHVREAFTESKLYIYLLATICINAGAATTSVFGPIILQSLVGFTADQAVLLNMPFGFLQWVAILIASWLAQRYQNKSAILFAWNVPVIVGVALLYALPKTKAYQGPLLLGYYLMSFLFSFNPLILAWMGSNVAGQTKKSTYYTAFNAASAVGNIIAPYLFNAKDAPGYKPAMQGILVIFCALSCLIVLQVFNLLRLQRKKENQREAAGLPRKMRDFSMDRKYVEAAEGEVSDEGLQDKTDQNNLYFTYLL